MKYILALDQGTTSSRALVIDHTGGVISSAQLEFTQHYPRPGWVEHDPQEIWATQSGTVAEALAKADLTFGDIAAIGITNQRETTILWDRRTGKPIHNAIVWQDRRTATHCEKLKNEGHETAISARTGLRLDPYFSATKIRWLLDHVDGARAAADAGHLAFGTVDTWLLWKLTGGKTHATDPTNASRTLLFDIHKGRWDEELLDLFRIPASLLPEVKPTSGHFATTTHGIPVTGIAGDQHAALFGQACFHPGMAKNTYGTGCFLLMNTGEKPIPSQNNLLTTIAWHIDGKTTYALEGSVFMAGAIVQWLRDEMKLVSSAEECSRLAASVPDTGGMYLVPAFSGLGAPHWDPHARGTCTGMTRGTNRAHFCRAAIEAIAFQSADLLSAMLKDSGMALQQLRVDGGASRSQPLMQFQSDLLRVEVIRPQNIETTALGAAHLAGLAIGYWNSPADIAALWKQDANFTPQRPLGEIHQLTSGWNQAIQRSKAWNPTGP